MRPRPTLALALACLCAASVACGPATSRAATALRVNGSTTVNAVVAEAAEVLRRERGLAILVDTQGGSSGGIHLVGEGRAEVGMSSRALHDADRAAYPKVDWRAHRIGEDAVALVVSADVWADGVRSLSRDQVRAIYEGRVTNWRELGGADRRIAFFNKEPGRGTWEVFATWLYGSPGAAPDVSFPEVGGNEETRSKVAATRGALSQLSFAWADAQRVFPLALGLADQGVSPSRATILAGTYPMRRPLFLVTDGPPTGAARELIDYVLSPAGQMLVQRQGYLPVEAPGQGPAN